MRPSAGQEAVISGVPNARNSEPIDSHPDRCVSSYATPPTQEIPMKNPLSDIVPAKARKYVYALAFVGGLGLTAWQAADGDWQKAVGAFVASLIPALAASNTDTEV